MRISSFLRVVFFLSIFLTAFSSVSWAACGAVVSNTVTCTNNTSITANNNQQVAPTTNTIPNGTLTGTVTKVTVTLNGVSTSDNLANAEVLLLAPDGTTKLVILNQVGDFFSAASGNLTLDDAQAAYSCGSKVTLPSSFHSVSCGTTGNPIPSPGFTVCSSQNAANCPPAQPQGTGPTSTLSTFNTQSGNGDWKLYVTGANQGGATFSFTGGWSITVTTSGVAAAGTTTTVSASPASVTRTPPNPSAPSTITATVKKTSDNSNASGGTVTFFDNGSPVVCGGGNQTVASGAATCIMTFTQEGIHPFTASYGGAAGFAPSNSTNTANVTVSNNTTTTNFSSTGGTYCNQGNIIISTTGNFAPGSPYPSNVFVGSNGGTNLPGVITNLTVDLKGIQAAQTDSPSLLLVGPSGTAYMLFADVGTSAASGPGNVTLGDGHAQITNFGTATVSPIDNHSNASQDETAFPPPAPQSGFLFPTPLGNGQPSGPSTIGQAYNGGGAIGTWQLYVLNDAGGTGSISGGWCLNFTVDPNKHATATAVTASPVASYTSSPFTSKFPPVPANDFVTFTSTTTSDITVNTGSVTFSDNGVNLTCGNGTTNPATVDGTGHATCHTTFSTEGNHVVKATFHAAATFGDSNSNTLARVDSHSTRTATGPVDYKYCNPSQIRSPAFGVAAGPSLPYPSNIFINDLPGTINKVRLGIPDLSFNATTMQELTSMLVGPNGNVADSIDLLSHIGQLSGAPGAINITLDDTGANGHFGNASDPTSGTWQPTSRVTATFPLLPTYPALSPAGPYPPPVGTPQYAFNNGATTFASVFGSGVANTRLGAGTWSLFQNMPNLNSNPILEGDNGANPSWCMLFTVNPPVVTVTKSDQGLQFRQGQQAAMVYTIAIHNNGPGPTGGTLTVSDTLPTGLTGNATPGSGTGWSCSGTATIICTNSDVIAQGGDYPLLTLSVNVANNAASSPGNPTHLVSNQGSVTGGGTVGTTNSNTTSTFVQQVADMTITKVHNGTFTQGDTGDTYTVTASNAPLHGPTVGQVMVTDTIPVGLTLTNAAGTNWNCNVAAPSFTCTRSDVLATGSSYEPITVTVNVSPTAPTSVMNTATVSGGGELDTSNDTATDTVNIVQLPDLTISKTHSGNFFQGQAGAQYTITVHNISATGPVVAGHTVTVSDTLPTGLTPTTAVGTGWTCMVSAPSVSCTRADALAVSASYPAITLTVNVAPDAAAMVTNTVTVSGGGEVITNNDSASDLTNITPGPDLTIAKTHSATFTQGDTGKTYSILVSNGGGTNSYGTVTVVDTVPSGLTATAAVGTGWVCNIVTPTVTCTSSTPIPFGGSGNAITLTVNVAANATSPQVNQVTVSGGGDVNNTNNSASDSTVIVQVADLTITKSHTGNFFQGQVGASYNVLVTNSGPGPTAGTVTVADTLPAGMTPNSAAGTGWSCNINVQVVSCNRSDVLAASASYPAITILLTVANNAPASLSNTATVSGGGEINTGNDSSTDQTTIAGGPDLTILKSHSGNFTVGDIGDTYTITVTNLGATTTVGTVTVSDTVPAGLTPTGVSGTGWTCNIVVQAVSCTRADGLALNASYPAITLTVNVANNAPAQVTNTAAVSGGGDVNPANNSSSDQTTIVQTVNIKLDTSPTGLLVSADGGANFTAPHTYQFTPGSMHTITTQSPQPGGAGTQFVFLNWNDGMAQTHNITTPAVTTTYTATFKTQFQLTIGVAPGGSGTVTPATGSFYDSGTVVNLQAFPNSGYSFASWTGNVANANANPTTITMNAPQTVTANMPAATTSESITIIGKSGTPNGVRVWTLRNDNAAGPAMALTYSSFTLAFAGGAPCTPVIIGASVNGGMNQPFPNVLVGDLAPSTSVLVAVSIDFTGCGGSSRFKLTMPFTANGGATVGSLVTGAQFQ